MDLAETHSTNDFIKGQYIDTTLCDEIINYFEASNDKTPGAVTEGINESKKKSTDLVLTDNKLLSKYNTALQQVFNEYIKTFPMSYTECEWGVVEPINIQRYYPKEGFYEWHTERDHWDTPVVNRNLVFMTYLNDVNDGGGTEFYHQQKIIQAKKGLTIVWPADWTYTHRGCISKTETKYIITGWASYYNKTGT